MRHHRLLAALVPCLVLAGCRSTATPDRIEDGMVAVIVENLSGSTVVAHAVRTGDTPVRLGYVLANSRRVFLVHHRRLGEEAILVATPNTITRASDASPADARTFTTVPFSGRGAREVRWVIRDGELLGRVRRAGRRRAGP